MVPTIPPPEPIVGLKKTLSFVKGRPSKISVRGSLPDIEKGGEPSHSCKSDSVNNGKPREEKDKITPGQEEDVQWSDLEDPSACDENNDAVDQDASEESEDEVSEGDTILLVIILGFILLILVTTYFVFSEDDCPDNVCNKMPALGDLRITDSDSDLVFDDASSEEHANPERKPVPDPKPVSKKAPALKAPLSTLSPAKKVPQAPAKPSPTPTPPVPIRKTRAGNDSSSSEETVPPEVYKQRLGTIYGMAGMSIACYVAVGIMSMVNGDMDIFSSMSEEDDLDVPVGLDSIDFDREVTDEDIANAGLDDDEGLLSNEDIAMVVLCSVGFLFCIICLVLQCKWGMGCCENTPDEKRY